MASANDVLKFLRPDGGWIIRGEAFEDIEFIDAEPFTREDFDNAFDEYDSTQLKIEAEKAAKKAELLAKLGITEEEAKLLLS